MATVKSSFSWWHSEDTTCKSLLELQVPRVDLATPLLAMHVDMDALVLCWRCTVRVSCFPEYNRRPGWLSGQTTPLPLSRTGFDSRRGRFQIFARRNRAGRCRCSSGFLGDIPLPPALAFRRSSILTSLRPYYRDSGRTNSRPARHDKSTSPEVNDCDAPRHQFGAVNASPRLHGSTRPIDSVRTRAPHIDQCRIGSPAFNCATELSHFSARSRTRRVRGAELGNTSFMLPEADTRRRLTTAGHPHLHAFLVRYPDDKKIAPRQGIRNPVFFGVFRASNPMRRSFCNSPLRTVNADDAELVVRCFLVAGSTLDTSTVLVRMSHDCNTCPRKPFPPGNLLASQQPQQISKSFTARRAANQAQGSFPETCVANQRMVTPVSKTHACHSVSVVAVINVLVCAVLVSSVHLRVSSGVTVAWWLDHSHPTLANRGSIHLQRGHSRGFRTWESCRTMPLSGEYSRGSPVLPRPCIPALLRTRLGSPTSALKTSDTNSFPNLFTRSQPVNNALCVRISRRRPFTNERRRNCKQIIFFVRKALKLPAINSLLRTIPAIIILHVQHMSSVIETGTELDNELYSFINQAILYKDNTAWTGHDAVYTSGRCAPLHTITHDMHTATTIPLPRTGEGGNFHSTGSNQRAGRISRTSYTCRPSPGGMNIKPPPPPGWSRGLCAPAGVGGVWWRVARRLHCASGKVLNTRHVSFKALLAGALGLSTRNELVGGGGGLVPSRRHEPWSGRASAAAPVILCCGNPLNAAACRSCDWPCHPTSLDVRKIFELIEALERRELRSDEEMLDVPLSWYMYHNQTLCTMCHDEVVMNHLPKFVRLIENNPVELYHYLMSEDISEALNIADEGEVSMLTNTSPRHAAVKAVHDKVSTLEINLIKKSLFLHAYILTGALSDIRPVSQEATEETPRSDGDAANYVNGRTRRRRRQQSYCAVC
ncbi:hypothetical protein PR048_019162 [Dryococelus australis]|uniref:Uncharacterized protein n=1 Tax=Dryococelus australis TaxID=614101 RepID=A0ABQ9H2Q4_9NEOP|nr:hypothetical protein PR048_019162 [Dryococelus australis]